MTVFSPKIKVVVLRGGPSPEYDISLKTGAYVLSLLREMSEKYEPVDVFISREGEWHLSGLVEKPYRALRHADIVWNALHGAYGEDGRVQSFLAALKIPFTGSGALSSALAANNDMAKEIFIRHSIPTPRHEVFTEGDLTDDRFIHIFRNYLHPVIVKPARGSKSLGITLAQSFQELKEKVKDAVKNSAKVLVEEFVRGKDVFSAVVEDVQGQSLYALIPNGELSGAERKEIETLAKLAHQSLGLRHYSSSRFIITPKGKIYLIETNTQPPFHVDSNLHRSLQAIAWHPKDFVDHILSLH